MLSSCLDRSLRIRETIASSFAPGVPQPHVGRCMLSPTNDHALTTVLALLTNELHALMMTDDNSPTLTPARGMAISPLCPLPPHICFCCHIPAANVLQLLVGG